jgi:hypothetical protein
MAANYDLPDAVEKRVRFFDGQFLQDQDFVDEQKYHLDRVRRHTKLLHVAGVADGLAVGPAGANAVTVGPGTAIDSDGRQLVLAQALTVDLPAETFNNKRGIRLYLTYKENAVDRQTEEGAENDTRWQERPEVVRVGPGQAYSGTAPPVLLAEVALDDKGTVTVDGTVRRYSGVRLPGPGADAPVMRAAGTGSVGLTGSLTVDGSVGIGTTSPRARLDIQQAARTGTHPTAVNGLYVTGDFGDAGDGVEFRHSNATSGIGIAHNTIYAAGTNANQNLNILPKGTGRVGIGTTNPGAKLEVAGVGGDTVDLIVNGRLRSNNNNGGLWVASDRFIGGHATDKVGFWTGQEWRLTVLQNGNVGIGTASPAARLDIQQAARSGTHPTAVKGLYVTGDFGDAGDGVEFRHSNATSGIGIAHNTIYAAGTNANQNLNILPKGTGRVGIGTTSPGARLEVAGGGGTSVDLVVNGRMRSNNNDGGLWVTTDRFIGGFGTGRVGFWNNGDWRLSVLNNGNVGVGTTDPEPANKLTVAAPSNHLQLRREGADTVGGTQLFLELAQPDVAPARVPEVHPFIRFHHYYRFWNRIEGQPGGFHFKVGDPASDDYVDIKAKDFYSTGQIYFHPGSEWGFEGQFGPSVQRYWYIFRPRWNVNNFSDGGPVLRASGMTFPSDLRFKDGISVIPGALEKLGRLRGVSFVWNELGLKHLTSDLETTVTAGPDASEAENRSLWQALREQCYAKLGHRNIGLIAQDVEQVVPELVHTDAEGYKRIDYSRLSALLVEAVKEQQSLVQGLQARIGVLEQRARA